MSRLFLIIGILLLLATEILRVYFIMPFPGSQHSNTIEWAYSIEKYKWILRIIGLALVAGPIYLIFTIGGKIFVKILLSVIVVLYAIIFYFFNFRFEADKMFYQPSIKNFSSVTENKIDSDKLVIGVEINGEAKAYP